ncbi:MAG: DUF2868 domain-containing protein [Desulfotignum sp.]|nr:DUF2868 domain-containing protein [Desulfotignum sp.]MCF8138564.1 DUF2868 domain-containing protein [Desulfotignum sp.]
MTLRLSDIMDLEYLLALDDQPGSRAAASKVAARDRDIFRQADGAKMTDNALVEAWLSYRRLLYFDQAGPKGYHRLPGQVFNHVFAWTARGMAFAGGLSGLALAYGFLAYHGVRPVNVALFFFVFVLVPAVFFLFFVAGLVIHPFRRSGPGPGMFFAVVSRVLFDMVPAMLQRVRMKIKADSSDPGPTRLDEGILFIRTKRREYQALFFWPLVMLVSLFALFFSAGALGGTLFRVTFSDVAFGWQSTLAATPSAVHDLVSLVSLPWAAWMPEFLAGPSPAQVEGTRIILKQGIAALATEHLTSWWPFLCMSMICYAVFPRLLIIGGAILGHRTALNGFDFYQPRFRRLIVRMKSPVMDIGLEENTAARHLQPEAKQTAGARGPVKDPSSEQTDANPHPALQPAEQDFSPATPAPIGTPAVVLAPGPAWDQTATDRVSDLLARQFFLDVRQVIYVDQDVDADALVLGPEVLDGADPVIFLQEVWQPPIRGILHYLVQLKQGVLQDKNLWVLLTQAPEEDSLGVADRDVDATVWQDCILTLGHPDMLVERIRP